MSPLLALGLLVAGFCPAVLCHSPGTPTPETLTQEATDNLRFASNNADFTFSLYKQLASRNPQENVVFSPLSISTALAFLALGAHNTTLMELLQGLKFNLTETTEEKIHQGFQHLLRTLSQPSDQLQLSIGNAMFVNDDLELLTKFTDDAQSLYEAQTFTTNFQDLEAAEKSINDYVKEKTQGKIVDLIKGLDPQTVMVLLNYIFFKAKWMTPFYPIDTFEARFYLSGKKWVKVPMMSTEDLPIPYFRDKALSCTVIQLDYAGNASALFILPDSGKMQKVEAMLLPDTLKRWRNSLQMKWIDELYLPKFRISSDFNLEDVLRQLGIREVFSKQADLSGVTGYKNLMVSKVIHKALLDVTEKGTEAVAATGVKMVLTSAKMGTRTIVNFNRPFLMAIVHEDVILFMSKVTNPKQT
ncbi:alpha-1-antichymotrypsin-like [Marmota monax]|uniref:Alpha-1-antichymotrypsin n=1 Tax=Marmota monax TaxID=9995 RepID=A0A834QF21_MARMO|nr:alpha-1-antichymotrypsin-like [Marmota monax]KAF7475313.1 alpha-1-antichymotrypsin [Marmota monax]